MRAEAPERSAVLRVPDYEDRAGGMVGCVLHHGAVEQSPKPPLVTSSDDQQVDAVLAGELADSAPRVRPLDHLRTCRLSDRVERRAQHGPPLALIDQVLPL